MRFEQRNLDFERRLPIVAASLLLLTSVILGVMFAIIGEYFTVFGSVVVGSLAVVTLVLSFRGKHKLGGVIIIIVGQVAVGLTAIASQELHALDVYAQTIFLVLVAFYISPKTSIYMGGFSCFVVLASNLTQFGTPGYMDDGFVLLVTSLIFLGVTVYLLYLFAQRAELNIVAHRRRLDHNEALFERVPDAANQLGATAQEIFSMSQEQQRGALQQSSAVDETHRSLSALLGLSEEIVRSSKLASRNAEKTLSNAELVSEHIDMLAIHAEGINEILVTIKELADKSDLLALNAALEGTRAGEAGRGFSIVASEMQKLAEQTAGAVVDIDKLTQDIGKASAIARTSMEELKELANTSTKATLQIESSTEQQRATVEHVTQATDDISSISAQVIAGKDQTIVSMEELKELALRLSEMVDQFRAAAE